MLSTLSLAVTLLVAQTPAACDPSAIRWVLPGSFPDAISRSKAENRLLVLKGISFGIDEVGAKCATKGDW